MSVEEMFGWEVLIAVFVSMKVIMSCPNERGCGFSVDECVWGLLIVVFVSMKAIMSCKNESGWGLSAVGVSYPSIEVFENCFSRGGGLAVS